MSWVAVGVRTTRELLRGLSPEAKVLWHVAREYCAEEETDGVIAVSILPQLGDRAEISASDLKTVASSLVTRGLWDRTPDGLIDVTFQEVNPSHDDRQRQRDSAKERKRRERQRKAEETADLSTSHTVTSQRDNRGANGRFRVVSHRDVTAATETETEQDRYTRRDSSSAKRTGKRATDNGAGIALDEPIDVELVERLIRERVNAADSTDDSFASAVRGEV